MQSMNFLDFCIALSRERIQRSESFLRLTDRESSSDSLSEDSASAPSAHQFPAPPKESTSYYFGLYSSPQLVYRTGTTPWKRPTGFEAYCQRKELRPVFGHKINGVWKDLGPKVCQLLDSKEVLWTSIDVVRFKDDTGPIGPVVLWIGVVPETLSTEDARTSANNCLDLLKEFGIADVDVEFRCSIYTRSAGPRLLTPSLLKPVFQWDPTVDVRGPLTAVSGLSIAAEATPHTEGTGGLYFAEGGTSKKVLLITARHVVFPQHEAPNYHYTRQDTSAPRRNVLLLSENRYEELVASIRIRIGQYGASVELYEEEIESLQKMVAGEDEDEDKVAQAKKELEKTQSSLKKANDAIEALKKFHNQVRSNWSHPKQRVLGHVVLSPPLTYNAGMEGFTEDYAVIALDRAMIKKAFTGNKMDLGTEISIGRFVRMMDPSYDKFKYPYDRLLPLRGIMTEELMLSPDTVDDDDGPCHSVIKSGSTTGVTIGRANGLFSFVRQYYPNNSHRTSKEWAIFSYDKDSGVFSAHGDSGSVIVDGNGRIGGILTGGAGKEEFDITYATPFFWLFDRIKENGFPNAYLLDPDPDPDLDSDAE